MHHPRRVGLRMGWLRQLRRSSSAAVIFQFVNLTDVSREKHFHYTKYLILVCHRSVLCTRCSVDFHCCICDIYQYSVFLFFLRFHKAYNLHFSFYYCSKQETQLSPTESTSALFVSYNHVPPSWRYCFKQIKDTISLQQTGVNTFCRYRFYHVRAIHIHHSLRNKAP